LAAANWLLIQDEFTGFICSIFRQANSYISELLLSWLHQFQKGSSLIDEFAWCENSGENV
jgi:hypothetical protein